MRDDPTPPVEPEAPAALPVAAASAELSALAWMLGVLSLACWIGMHTLLDHTPWNEHPVRQLYAGAPRGYTWSLALYVVPIAALLLWYARAPRQYPGWKAVGLTAAVIVPLWSLLDIFLANTFFVYPNRTATLGVFAPGWSWGAGWVRNIPVEEFAFYLTGCLLIVLGYRWASHFWFPHHDRSVAEYRAVAQRAPRPRLGDFVKPLAASVAVVALGFWYKRHGHHPFTEGFPGYLLFLVMVVALPTAIAFRVVRWVLNVRAFLLITLFMLGTSLLWEVTLALPHGWWDFRHAQMVGLFITHWSHLPIEEPILWVAAAWSNVTLYEFWRLVVDGQQHPRTLLLGAPDP